jgi:ribosomal protein S18 acetylase RimI-like enzyme
VETKRLVVVYVLDKKVIAGFLVGTVPGIESCIEWVYCEPEYRSQKYISQAWAVVLKYVYLVHIPVVLLEVDCYNTNAINIYEYWGFTQIGMRKNYYGPGKHGLVYRKNITKEKSKGNQQ